MQQMNRHCSVSDFRPSITDDSTSDDSQFFFAQLVLYFLWHTLYFAKDSDVNLFLESFSYLLSKRTFSYIDRQIHWALWRWAKRRHKEKSSSWIRQKYFDEKKSQRSIFHTHAVNGKGERVTIRLFEAAKVPIQRHIKIRGNSNPYDPAWEIYFEQRQYHKVLHDFADRPRLRHQWQMQRGLCPVCKEPHVGDTYGT